MLLCYPRPAQVAITAFDLGYPRELSGAPVQPPLPGGVQRQREGAHQPSSPEITSSPHGRGSAPLRCQVPGCAALLGSLRKHNQRVRCVRARPRGSLLWRSPLPFGVEHASLTSSA